MLSMVTKAAQRYHVTLERDYIGYDVHEQDDARRCGTLLSYSSTIDNWIGFCPLQGTRRFGR